MDQIKRLDELKQKWQQERPEYDYFVSDGILNHHRYNTQSPKIMFLLKEANDDFVNIAPLSSNEIGYGPKGNSGTFWRYMRGYEAIIQLVWNNEKFNRANIEKIKEQPNNNTAYVNIKKQCENKYPSNPKDLLKYTKQDHHFLNEQINLINPDVIYCAGTFEFYKILDSDCYKLSSKIYMSKERIVIDYLHLAHRYGYKTYEELYKILDIPELKKIIVRR